MVNAFPSAKKNQRLNVIDLWNVHLAFVWQAIWHVVECAYQYKEIFPKTCIYLS